MMGHHACHGGYNRSDPSGRFSSRGFALGSLWRRLQDWFDWMLPEAWSVEHNQLHHYRLSEADGRLVGRLVGSGMGFHGVPGGIFGGKMVESGKHGPMWHRYHTITFCYIRAYRH